MSSLICSNCDWYKGCECSNRDSEHYKAVLGKFGSCDNYFPRLTMKLEEIKTLEMKDEKYESINHPSHYNQGIEAIDYIESHKMNFNIGNVIKYVTRAKHKGTELQDLKKGLWYLKREIDKLEKENN